MNVSSQNSLKVTDVNKINMKWSKGFFSRNIFYAIVKMMTIIWSVNILLILKLQKKKIFTLQGFWSYHKNKNKKYMA